MESKIVRVIIDEVRDEWGGWVGGLEFGVIRCLDQIFAARQLIEKAYK